jgi:hypothetical protein
MKERRVEQSSQLHIPVDGNSRLDHVDEWQTARILVYVCCMDTRNFPISREQAHTSKQQEDETGPWSPLPHLTSLFL